MRRILVATDGSEGAARAATHISNRTAAELHLAHVWMPVPHPPSPAFDDLSGRSRAEARELLRRLDWDARVAGGRVAGTHLREGLPAGEIVALARELGTDLVVVGGPSRRPLAGGVAGRVARRAPCPVLIVGGGRWPAARVVVADDGSEPAARAGVLSAEISAICGAELVVVSAYEHPPAPVGGRGAPKRRELDAALALTRRALQRRAEELEETARSRPKTRLVRSKLAPALRMIAEETGGGRTLVAIGVRGPFDAWTAAMRVSTGPVLVVPGGKTDAIDLEKSGYGRGKGRT